MKRFSRLAVSLIITFTISLSLFSTYSYGNWWLPFYEDTTHQYIGSGIEHEQILRFTDKGWYNVNILKADIDSPYVTLDLLHNQEGIGVRKKLSELANQNQQVVAAVNGDFFNTQGAASLGPMIHKGQLLTTPFYLPSQMGTFNMTEKEKAFIRHWSLPNITVTNNENQETLLIEAVNKETQSSDITVVYTSAWGKNTPPISPKLSTAVEMIVSNNQILEINPAVSSGNLIPAQGYVIFATGSKADYIQNSFAVGDKVTYHIDSDLDYEELSLALGGGAILVENGIAKEVFSHDITGNHPRTAIGITKGNEILLVTIDGRTASFPGVSQKELAQIMVELGAHSAINLDGGGSTNMILRPVGQESLSIANHLSVGSERNITNGLGIVSTAPKSSLKGLVLKTEDLNVFVNTSRKILVSGYDKNYNPKEINPSQIKWTVDGANGEIKEGVFIPTQPGKVLLTAEYQGVKESLELRVLNAPSALSISPSKITLSPNSSLQLSVKASTMRVIVRL